MPLNTFKTKLGLSLKTALGRNSANIKMKMVEKIVCDRSIVEGPNPILFSKGSNNIAMYKV